MQQSMSKEGKYAHFYAKTAKISLSKTALQSPVILTNSLFPLSFSPHCRYSTTRTGARITILSGVTRQS